MVDISFGPLRLVGTFSGENFVGTFSDQGCVYDYQLQKVARPDRLTMTALYPPGNHAPVPPPAQQPSNLTWQVLPTPERHPGARTDTKKPAAAASLALAEQLARRGEQLGVRGRIADARRFFERAALAGNGRGALDLGTTYDPLFLSGINANGVDADALVAKVWYLRAQMFGNKEAESKLEKLRAWHPR
jgi:TPR repeat protein